MSRPGVVFGGSRGIGQAVSQLLAQRGHRVVVVSRNKEAAQAAAESLPGDPHDFLLQTTKEDLETKKIQIQNLKDVGVNNDDSIFYFRVNTGHHAQYEILMMADQCHDQILILGGHLGLSCDVSKEEEVQRTFEVIGKTCGTVGYLVNAAGINRDALLLRSKSEDMVSVLHTNLLGSMLTCRAALRSMLSHGGAIVNIGSLVGVKGNAGQCVYSASKAGLEGFTRSLAKEVAARNIRVNLVAPGFIQTDMTAGLEKEELVKRIPLARFGEPTEVSQAVLFLLESPYITGQILIVDGGLQLAM